MTVEVDNLASDLQKLGIGEHDHVLVRTAHHAPTPRAAADQAAMLIRALQKVIGPEGTIVALTFSNGFLRPEKRPDRVFHRGSRCVTGAFAETLRTWPGAHRSRHPLNSFSAIGGGAEELVRDHDVNSACFAPMEKLIEWKGKMLLVGCVESSPGFSTVHLAQYHLGLSERTWMSGLKGILWRDESRVTRTFRPRDIPGCNAGFSNYYTEYVRQGLLRAGTVGGTYAISAPCAEAYELERRLLVANPRSALCADPACMSCRATLYYNKRDWPLYFLRNGMGFARRALAHLQGRSSER